MHQTEPNSFLWLGMLGLRFRGRFDCFGGLRVHVEHLRLLAILVEKSVVALMTSIPRICKSIFVDALGRIFLAAVDMVAVITHAFGVVFSSSMLAIGDYFSLTASTSLCGYWLGHHLSRRFHLGYLLTSTTLIRLFILFWLLNYSFIFFGDLNSGNGGLYLLYSLIILSEPS